jgi:hypothetical protein
MLKQLYNKIQFLLFITWITSILVYCYSTNNTISAQFVHQITKNTLEFVNSPDIKSVKIHKLGWELSEPTIELNSNEKLLISFDDLGQVPGSYSYSLTHCDSEWNPTSLFFTDFMDGFEINDVRDYSSSSGTIINYIHNRIEIPNQDIRIKISGNYIIKIFNSYQHNEIIIQRRFIVYEPLLSITASIRQPSAGEHRLSGQQLELTLNTSGLRVSDPFSEIKTKVCQNYIFQGCYENIKPVFIRGNEIIYSDIDALIFNGGNEYRIFDIKNIRYAVQGVQSINFHGGLFHVELNIDQSRRRNRYSYYPDLNGRYVVTLDRSTQSHIEADYVWTYFTLKTPIELDEGKSVYLFGEHTGWQLSPSNKMAYNHSRGAYETRLLLKQGGYSYIYLVGNDKTGEIDITQFEGSFYETENNYSVIVYYKPLGARYERVVGYNRISTKK